MMIMVEGMANSGFFRWLCMKIAKLVKYQIIPIFITFMLPVSYTHLGNATAATTDATSDILSTTTITLYDSDGNTVSVERTIYKNYDCEYVDADGMEYSTDDDVYFTDENGKTYRCV